MVAASPLDLRVADAAGQLHVEWNRQAAAIREAAAGTLEIRDGTAVRLFDLDTDLLRHGSFYYVRSHARVRVHLRVQRTAVPAGELTWFIDPAPRRGRRAPANL